MSKAAWNSNLRSKKSTIAEVVDTGKTDLSTFLYFMYLIVFNVVIVTTYNLSYRETIETNLKKIFFNSSIYLPSKSFQFHRITEKLLAISVIMKTKFFSSCYN